MDTIYNNMFSDIVHRCLKEKLPSFLGSEQLS